MKIHEISASVEQKDAEGIRSAFRALVDYPHDDSIEGATPFLLDLALYHVSHALLEDPATMPRGTCDALDLKQGATYAQGAQAARVQNKRFARRFAEGTERRAAAGRAH